MEFYANTFSHNQPERKPFPLNLQLFAEEGADPNAGGDDAGQGEGEPNQNQNQPRMYTEEEVKAKLDHHMAQYRKSESRRIEQAREEARSEAEKLARMNEEQRAEHERQRAEQAAKEREAAIARREAEITRRELRAEAIDTLHKRGLPAGLEAVLNYTDADACNASIDTVEKAFREAVQQGVDERLKQSGVKLNLGGADATMNAAMRRAAGLPD